MLLATSIQGPGVVDSDDANRDQRIQYCEVIGETPGSVFESQTNAFDSGWLGIAQFTTALPAGQWQETKPWTLFPSSGRAGR